MSLAQVTKLVTAELALLAPELAFFFDHSSWDLVIRIHKDLRTGNQDDSIQFSPFQIRIELCTS